MGFNDHQYVLTRHTDTAHEHVHLVTSRIGCDGSLTSDSHERRRMQTLMAEIEEDYGLQEVLGHSVMVPPLSPAELEPPAEIERLPELERPPALEPPAQPPARPTREEIQLLCDASAVDCHSFTEYASRLAMVGVEIIPTVQQQGAKLTGLAYSLDGETIKGSDVGKAYAAAGIQARGISYEQARDFAAVEGCRARAVERGDLAPPRSREAEARQWGVEKVAQNKALAAQLAEIKDPEQRAEAQRLLSEIKQEATGRAASREREQAREKDRGRGYGDD